MATCRNTPEPRSDRLSYVRSADSPNPRITVLIHPVTGDPLPPILTVKQTAEILLRAQNTVLLDCADGSIATMPRRGSGDWQIITAKLLRQLGLLPDELAQI